jgi:hypothetical protein
LKSGPVQTGRPPLADRGAGVETLVTLSPTMLIFVRRLAA